MGIRKVWQSRRWAESFGCFLVFYSFLSCRRAEGVTMVYVEQIINVWSQMERRSIKYIILWFVSAMSFIESSFMLWDWKSEMNIPYLYWLCGWHQTPGYPGSSPRRRDWVRDAATSWNIGFLSWIFTQIYFINKQYSALFDSSHKECNYAASWEIVLFSSTEDVSLWLLFLRISYRSFITK